MVPMHDFGIVEATHEPSLRPRRRPRSRPRLAGLASRTRPSTRTKGFKAQTHVQFLKVSTYNFLLHMQQKVVPKSGSWFRCTISKSSKLPMNRPFVLVV